LAEGEKESLGRGLVPKAAIVQGTPTGVFPIKNCNLVFYEKKNGHREERVEENSKWADQRSWEY